jgi:general secretion pathway protein D
MYGTYNTYAAPLDSFEARNASIIDFLHWVSDQTGENIILGKGVEGNITVVVKSIDSSQVMPFFKRVMKANGYSVKKTEEGFFEINTGTVEYKSSEPRISKIYNLQNLRNTKAKAVFETLLKSSLDHDNIEGAAIANTTMPAVVEILPSSNGLLVSGTASQIESVDIFASEIDTESRQVVIEAVIVESDAGIGKSVGVNLSTALSANGFSAVTSPLGAIMNASPLGEGGHLIFSQGGDLAGLISAIEKTSNSKILSHPQILIMDRERGNISVGQNVPFLTSRQTTDGGTTIQQIERKDVGVTLAVVPHILSNGSIILQIQQESSSVTDSSIAADIITNTRSISTVASLKDGQTILLGGLVSDESRTQRSGVPFFKDIPWLGRLFQFNSKSSIQRELSVLIKTTVI